MSINYPQIDLININKKYGKNIIFNNFNFLFTNKNINCIVGINGRGKSTLLKIILGITSYKGIVNKNNLTFSYAPEFIKLPENVKVCDFLGNMNIDYKYALIMLDKFKIHSNKTIKELSKGMRQKILLIQALAKNVDCYLFDEPLSGLDNHSVEVFSQQIDQLYNNGKLIIICTHLFEKLHSKNVVKVEI